MFTIGQKVVLLPHLTCWEESCLYCSTYRQNLCTKMQHMGFHIQGNMTGMMAYPEQCVMGIPPQLHDDLIPLIEPLACVSRGIFFIKDALRKIIANYHEKESARFVIYGGGPIGALAAICCKVFFPKVIVEIIEPVNERATLLKKLRIADVVSNTPCNKHDVCFIANSFFKSIESALDNSSDNGSILLFSGINTDEFTDKPQSIIDYVKNFERIHRQETTEVITHKNATVKLIGSSGYNYSDIRRSTNLLLSYSQRVSVLQNAVIDGLDSKIVEYNLTKEKVRLNNQEALLVFLAPEGVFDSIYGSLISRSIKTLIRIH